jgi:elongation of very long chain fatty acids protein 6
VGGTGVIFAGMNLSVHAVMYGYYALAAMGFRPPFPVAITIIQILQMLIGTYVVIVSIPCSTHHSTTYAALAMYSSYFVLFFLFFLNRYVFAAKKAPSTKDPRVSAETRVNKFKIH